jgi:sugar lactone lactonase YvrE
MPDRRLTTLRDGGAFFEGPRWHDGRWWVSDFYRQAVYTVGTDGTEELVVEVENQPSGLGWLPDGSLLIVSMKE